MGTHEPWMNGAFSNPNFWCNSYFASPLYSNYTTTNCKCNYFIFFLQYTFFSFIWFCTAILLKQVFGIWHYRGGHCFRTGFFLCVCVQFLHFTAFAIWLVLSLSKACPKTVLKTDIGHQRRIGELLSCSSPHIMMTSLVRGRCYVSR